MSTRLLICEDQELVRTGCATVFEAKPDMTVIGEAADGPAAVETATRLAPAWRQRRAVRSRCWVRRGVSEGRSCSAMATEIAENVEREVPG
jgi:hypothetical protein